MDEQFLETTRMSNFAKAVVKFSGAVKSDDVMKCFTDASFMLSEIIDEYARVISYKVNVDEKYISSTIIDFINVYYLNKENNNKNTVE
jgi:hypothetical protein